MQQLEAQLQALRYTISEAEMNERLIKCMLEEMTRNQDNSTTSASQKVILCELTTICNENTERVSSFKIFEAELHKHHQTLLQRRPFLKKTCFEKYDPSQSSIAGHSKMVPRKRFYGYFPENIKKSAVDAVIAGQTIRQVSQDMGICYKNIERWLAKGTKRRHSRRPKRNGKLQYELHQWILAQMQINRKITIGDVRRQALNLNSDENFKASTGWARQYAKRWRLQQFIVDSNCRTHNL